jgi:hypothetical protein
MANNVVLGYSPTDFFYVNATDKPTADECKSGAKYDPNATKWATDCNSTNITSNTQDCTKMELCKNQQLGSNLSIMTNIQKGGEEKYMDSKLKYDIALMNVINLGIGILFAGFIIYQNQNIK